MIQLAVLSESAADEAAIRILAGALLKDDTEPPPMPPLRSRGWPSVLQLLPMVIKHLLYKTTAEALITVVDSNCSPIHEGPIEEACDASDACRICLLRSAVAETLANVTPVPNRTPLRVAVGLAVPAIEAWYLCGVQTGVDEGVWFRGMRDGQRPFSKNDLKRQVYGTSRPSLELETQKAIEAVERVSGTLELLEQRFPVGFGPLADALRTW